MKLAIHKAHGTNTPGSVSDRSSDGYNPHGQRRTVNPQMGEEYHGSSHEFDIDDRDESEFVSDQIPNQQMLQQHLRQMAQPAPSLYSNQYNSVKSRAYDNQQPLTKFPPQAQMPFQVVSLTKTQNQRERRGAGHVAVTPKDFIIGQGSSDFRKKEDRRDHGFDTIKGSYS